MDYRFIQLPLYTLKTTDIQLLLTISLAVTDRSLQYKEMIYARNMRSVCLLLQEIRTLTNIKVSQFIKVKAKMRLKEDSKL